MDRKYGYETMVGISKLLITICISIIGAFYAALIAIEGPVPIYTIFAKIALVSCGFTVISAILINVAIISQSFDESTFFSNNPVRYFAITWLGFLLSVGFASAFVFANV